MFCSFIFWLCEKVWAGLVAMGRLAKVLNLCGIKVTSCVDQIYIKNFFYNINMFWVQHVN